MSDSDGFVSWWLVPSIVTARPCKTVIEALATETGGPLFQPHLTLASTVRRTQDLATRLAQTQQMTLWPQEIDATSQFTKSLFVRFETSPELQDVRRALERHRDFRPGRVFDPHISLCYGPAPAYSMQGAEIKALLKHPLNFDQIWAVHMPVPVRNFAAVSAWQVVQRVQLRPAETA